MTTLNSKSDALKRKPETQEAEQQLHETSAALRQERQKNVELERLVRTLFTIDILYICCTHKTYTVCILYI